MCLYCLEAFFCLEALSCLVCFEAFDWDGWDVGWDVGRDDGWDVGWDVSWDVAFVAMRRMKNGSLIFAWMR